MSTDDTGPENEPSEHERRDEQPRPSKQIWGSVWVKIGLAALVAIIIGAFFLDRSSPERFEQIESEIEELDQEIERLENQFPQDDTQ